MTNGNIKLKERAERFAAKVEKNLLPKDTLPNTSQAFDFNAAFDRFKKTVDENKKSLITTSYK